MSGVVPCQSIGVIVRFGDVTCFSDGTVTASGPAVIYVQHAARALDGRSRRVGRLQAEVLRAVASGLRVREDVARAVGASQGAVASALASLVRKGMLKAVRATPGGPCRTYYLLPSESADELISRLGLRPCRKSRTARKSRAEG